MGPFFLLFVAQRRGGCDLPWIWGLGLSPAHQPRQPVDLIDGQPQRLSPPRGWPSAAARDDRGDHRRPIPAVAAVDVLNDLLPALVLEVHIDVRRLAPLLAEEALEEQGEAGGYRRW